MSIYWDQSPREAGAELKQQMRAVGRTAALPACLGCNRLFLLMSEIPCKSGPRRSSGKTALKCSASPLPGNSIAVDAAPIAFGWEVWGKGPAELNHQGMQVARNLSFNELEIIFTYILGDFHTTRYIWWSAQPWTQRSPFPSCAAACHAQYYQSETPCCTGLCHIQAVPSVTVGICPFW